MQSLSSADQEDVLQYGRLPPVLEWQLKLTVEQDFAGLKFTDVMAKPQAPSDQAVDLILPITNSPSAPQSTTTQLILPDKSTLFEKNCQDLLKAISDEVTIGCVAFSQLAPTIWAGQMILVKYNRMSFTMQLRIW